MKHLPQRSHSSIQEPMRDERLFPLFQPLDALPGIGARLKPIFERLTGGRTVWDLLLHMPERWLDRRVVEQFADLVPGEMATVQGTVHSVQAPYTDRAPARVKLYDGSGFLTLVYFRTSSKWLADCFPVDAERIVSGHISDFRGECQMNHPDFVLDPKRDSPPPRVEPLYPLTAGLTNKRVHAAMKAALALVPSNLPEWIEPALIAKKTWPCFHAALGTIHAPAVWDETALAGARARLAYDEALARAMTAAHARAARANRSAPIIPTMPDTVRALTDKLPFTLTNAQKRVTQDIMADMASGHPMRRMVQGDVGSGKTLIAAIAAMKAAKAGFQTAFMAPTEILAHQQYDTLSKLLSPLGHTIGILTGRGKGRLRDATLMALADGTIEIITGTQALFQNDLTYRKLGLIVIDEQHRFGVGDRMKLAGKADRIHGLHVLIMSATPIPRTLAQAANSDLDMSILDEKPPGRQPIETRIIADTRIDDVIQATGRGLKRGERAFWICPHVDSENEEIAGATRRVAMLAAALNVPVGLVHGRMNSDEKTRALEDFRNGHTRLLVATTVIEVGIDVPQATIMVIEHAERFGLAQLHQLRGRVGRGGKPGFCLLLYHPTLSTAAQKRLHTLRHTQDGFEIADADHRLRGSGDLLGKRQSGFATYRLIDLDKHGDLIAMACDDAHLTLTRPNNEKSGKRAAALIILDQLLGPRLTFSD